MAGNNGLVLIAIFGIALYLVVVLVEQLVSWQPADMPIGGLSRWSTGRT